MKTTTCVLVVCGGLLAVGCGQKGPLYLPDKNAAVVTRPAGGQGESQQTPQNRAPEPPPAPTSQGGGPKQDKDKDKDDSKSNSTPRS